MTYAVSTEVTEENTEQLDALARWLPRGRLRILDNPNRYVLIVDGTIPDIADDDTLDLKSTTVQQRLLSVVPTMFRATNIDALIATAQGTDTHIRTFLSHPGVLLLQVSPGNYVVRTDDGTRKEVALDSTYLEEVPKARLLDYQNHIVFMTGSSYYTTPTVHVNSERRFVNRVYGQLSVPKYVVQDTKGYYDQPLTTDSYNFADYLAEQIRVRYAFFDRPKSGLSNVIMDSFFPRLMFKHQGDKKAIQAESIDFPSTAVAISPFVAEYLNVKKVPTEQLCRVLGYTVPNIKKLLIAVKRKKINFIFVGAGGTGMNTAYWLSELMKITSTYKVFSKVGVFEKDSVEYSNMLRFPLDSSAYNITRTSTNKMHLLAPLIKNLGTRKPEFKTNYLTNAGYMCSDMLSTYPTTKVRDNTVLYGAPGIEYRDELSEIGPLICATHANTSCSIWLNPKQNQDIQVETYGIIQLGSFFMNQLQMTIELLKLLASGQDLSEPDKHIMDFEFNGTLQLRPDRNYNWQIDHNNLVMTTAEANNF